MSVKLETPNNWLARVSLDLLFPVECVGCRAEGWWVCNDCRPQLVVSRSDICVLCAKAGQDGLCATCRKRTGLGGAVSLFTYTNPLIRELIKAGKFHGHYHALQFVGRALAETVFERLPSREATFVPVPLGAKRLAERGYNQAVVFARALRPRPARFFTGLTRRTETSPQSLLAKVERLSNVKDSFVCNQPAPERVILVDDVVTTGATLAAAAAALKKAGAKNVWAVTIAHG